MVKWAVLLVALLFPVFVDFASYPIYVANLSMIYAIVAMALNLLTGFGGQVSIGHAGFIAIGAYASSIFTLNLGIPFWIALPLAGLFTAIIGFIMGLPAVKLSGHYLAIATLGFGVAIPQIALKWDSLTGGFAGLFPERPHFLMFELNTDTRYFYLLLAGTVLIIWMLHNIIKSKAGRAFIAIRESEIAATAMGINVPLYKTIMFSVSAFFTGVAGSFYAHMINFISPNDFIVTISFLVLAMVVVGGLASIPGSILGAVLLTLIPQLTDKVLGLSTVVEGLALVLIILFLPGGLISLFTLKRKKAAELPAENGAAKETESYIEMAGAKE
jgi:branched-chain amino acid transport system permease protein